MATITKWTPFGVALNVTATGGTVTRTSATKFTVKINASWETYWDNNQTNYGMTASSGGGSVTLNPFGTKAHSGSGSFTGTYSISGNGAATKSITVTFKNYEEDYKGNVTKSATKSVSFNVGVPAWTSYSIKYSANGGSGAPGSQTKWKDQTLTLSSTKPTRTGYSFLGWSTSSTATTATYSAGGSYTANAAATLYAVWKANTYTVTYNANDGSGAPAEQTKTYGVTLKLSSAIPTRTNYTFKGWATSASATVAAYSAGGNYTTNAAVTLYAVWELAYRKPSISGVSVSRNEAGDVIAVKCSWTTYVNVTDVLITYTSSAGTSNKPFTATGKNGTIDTQLTGLNPELAYTVRIIVTDSKDSTTVSRPVPGLVFAMDVKAKAKGVAFGKAAELDGYVDFGFKTKHRANMEFEHNKTISGTNPDGTIVEAFNPQNGNGNTVIGYGNYIRGEGNTNIYGYDIFYGIGNIAKPDIYKPYLRRGDSFTITFRGSGYVTNACKDVSFWLPLTTPVVGSPTVTATSNNGFVFRQGDKYTHGSNGSVYVIPDSYEVINYYSSGLYIKAVFSNTTNVTNNDSIGIYWNGTITFS